MAGLYIERKREFHLGRWFLILAFIALLAAAGWLGFRWFTTGEKPPLFPLPAYALADGSVDESVLSKSAIDSYSVPKTDPKFISIPALSLTKARVQAVGLTANKTLGMPKNISDAGWYKESGFPGQGYGAVLIDGHNTGINRNGAFFNLHRLKEGDKIIIERGDGKEITYTVVENRTETLREANTSGMKRLLTPFDTEKEGLGLITFAGNWVPRDKVFDTRILIRAVADVSEDETGDDAQASEE